MDWLALALEDRFSGMLGEAALNVGDLTEQRPLAGAISFVQVITVHPPFKIFHPDKVSRSKVCQP